MDTERRLSVLLIDSHDTDRNYYADRLERQPYEYVVHQAATAKDGLQAFEIESIDCVVLELDLSDHSGFEVLVRLVPVASKPGVPVLVLTHLSTRVLVDLALKNGAVAYLQKRDTSGDVLEKTILKAVSTVTAERKKPPP
jgi:DNA-binding NarL/FixJ family response regulator